MMMTSAQLANNLKSYIYSQLDIMSKSTPVVGFLKPLITRVLDKNFNKVTKTLDLIADGEGNIDIDTILSEMLENVMNTNPFTINTSFIGNVNIGGGQIEFNVPLTNKKLVLNMSDLKEFKEILISK